MVLDDYCSCGTTVALSQRLDRKWIGIDITYQSISLILKRLEDAFGKGAIANITVNGIPKGMESAIALALKQDNRTRKEFENGQLILTYSNNRAIINQKKGVDGIAYIRKNVDELEKVILQVKSGNVKSADIRDLLGTITSENAAIGILITLKSPSKDMIKSAKEAGVHKNMYRNESIDKIQIVTVREIVEAQKRMNLPPTEEVLKSAEKQMEVLQSELDFS